MDGSRLELAQDLADNLAWADRFFEERFQKSIDTYIERAGIDAPPDDRKPVTFQPPQPTDLDLDEAGISTIIWTTGYRLDYRWIDLPIFDEQGFPAQRRGVADVAGLFFLGLLWQHTQASATLFGVGLDARYLAAQMGLPIRDEGAALQS